MARTFSKLLPPENDSPFFVALRKLLTNKTYTISGDYVVPQGQTVPLTGRVAPFAVVQVFVNGVNVSPVPDLVADEDGNFTLPVILGPGQNRIQVRYFPPALSATIDAAVVPDLVVDMPLEHPTLFSQFSLANDAYMVLIDGGYLYVGNFIPPPADTKTIARYDLSTGATVVLDLSSGSPTSGRVYYLAQDATYLYSAQTMGDSSIKLSRYAKDLSARLDYTGYASIPSSVYADGSDLFAAREDSGTDVKVSKLDPSAMTLVGIEVSTKEGTVIGETVFNHHQMTEDGSGNLVIPVTQFQFGDGPSNQIEDGSPGMGASLVQAYYIFVRKLAKADLSNQGLWRILSTGVDATYIRPNSLVRYGGFYYALAGSNPGKVLKLQEQVIDTLNYLVPVEVTPLPFAVDSSESPFVPRMVLGPDGRLYATSGGGLVRLTPGASSMDYVPRGKGSVAVTLNDVAVVDDLTPSAVISAPNTLFSDRATTFTAAVPSTPANVRCHWNRTHNAAGVQWDLLSDGAAAVVEMSVDGQTEGWQEVGREYFGDGMWVTGSAMSAAFPSWAKYAGDTVHFRVKASNIAGDSGYSNTATVSIPFAQPPISDQSSLAVTAYSALSVSLQWTDEEIDLAQPGSVGPNYNRSHVVRVYRSTDNFATVNELVGTVDNAQTQFPYLAGSDVLTFTDATAQAGTLYYYRVRGESTYYAPGNYSNVVSQATNPVFPLAVPDAAIPAAVATEEPAKTLTLDLADISDSPQQSMALSEQSQIGHVSGNVAWACIGNQTAAGNPDFYRIDFSTNSVDAITLNVQQIAFDGTDLWAAVRNGNLKRLNPTTLTETASIGSSMVSTYWDGSDLWALRSNGVVQKVDRTLLTLTSLGPGTDVTAASYGIVKVGAYIYALTNTASSPVKVTKIDPATPSIVATFSLSVPAASNLYSDGTYLYIQSKDKLHAWKVDPSTGALLASIYINQVNSGYPLTPAADGTGGYFGFLKVPWSGATYYKASAGLPFTNLDVIIADTGANVVLRQQVFGSPNSTSFARFSRFPTASLNADLGNSPVAFPVPVAPSGLSALAVGETVQLNWTDNNSGYTLFRIERSANAGPFIALATQGPSPVSFTDTTPPGGSASLVYRVYAVTNGGEAYASVNIVSPVSDATFQIAEVGTTHVSYAANGTDAWAAYDAAGTVYAAKIDSSLVRSNFTLQAGNTGGQVRRLLCDGSYIYVVTAGNPIKIRRYDLTGAFVGPEFSLAGTTADACIGSGYIWFLYGTQIKKLSTADMATLTTMTPGVGSGSLSCIIYQSSHIYANEDVQSFSSRKTYKYDTSDTLISSAFTDGGKFRATPGYYSPFARDTMAATCIDQGSGTDTQIFGYNEGSLGSRYLVGPGAQTTAYRGITYDFGTEKYYSLAGGSPGTIKRLNNVLNFEDTRSKNAAVGQDDEILHVNGKTFFTITDGTAGSGFSILSITF